MNQLIREAKEPEAHAKVADDKVNQALAQVYPDLAEPLKSATEILEEGTAKLTNFINAKKAEMPPAPSPNGGFNIGDFVALELETSEGEQGLLKSEIIGFQWEGAVAQVKVGTSEHVVDIPTVLLQRWNMLETSTETASDASQNVSSTSDGSDTPQIEEKAPEAPIRSFSMGALVELVGGVRGRVVSSDAAFVYVRTPAQLEDCKRHDEKWAIDEVTLIGPEQLIDEIIVEEEKIVETVLKIRDMLRQPSKALEAEVPFIALYVSGAENVELLFNHYITIIRADDPDMTTAQAKIQAAAVFLYQFNQEFVTIELETKYPAIYEAFKVASKHEMLIEILLRISGVSGFVEMMYDDDLMTRLVDLVSYVPF
jgi:hypothetical protein